MADVLTIPSDLHSIAVVGVAKNSGKTTTLRHLVARDGAEGRRVGVVSIGVDGESTDALSGTTKPSLELPAGAFAVTASRAAEASSARFEYVAPLGFETPLGRVLLLRVREAGSVVLAGIRHRVDLQRATERLTSAGVDRIFVDGAYGRTVAADGRVADAVVLATGAVAGDSPEDVADATAPLVSTIQIPAIDDESAAELGRRSLDRNVAARLSPDGDVEWNRAATAVAGLDFPDGDARVVAIPTLVSDAVVDELTALADDDPTLVVPAASHFQTSPAAWRRLRQHWTVRCLHPTRLLGMSVNASRPSTEGLPPRQLARTLRRRFRDLPVVDVVRERDEKLVAPSGTVDHIGDAR